MQHRDLFLLSQFGVQVGDLHWRHVNDIQMRLWPEAAHQVFREIAIDAGHLQHIALDDLTHLFQGKISKS